MTRPIRLSDIIDIHCAYAEALERLDAEHNRPLFELRKAQGESPLAEGDDDTMVTDRGRPAGPRTGTS